MKKSLRILLILSPVVIAGLLYILFQSTDPASIGPGGVLGVFILLYLGFMSVVFILLRFGRYWVKKILVLRGGKTTAVLPGMDSRKAYYIASILAFIPVTLLAMHAYSRLQLSDVALVLLFTALVTFYIVKRR